MNIAVLEWICGGGLNNGDVENSEDTTLHELRTEGWAMLSATAHGLIDAGHHLHISVASDIYQEALGNDVFRGATLTSVASNSHKVPNDWVQIAKACDLTIVIAPELGAVLTSAIRTLERAGANLLNCTGDFLNNASNKLLTSQQLQANGVAHPPTVRLANVTALWMEKHKHQCITQGGDSLWIIKPIEGAGCHDIKITTSIEVKKLGAAETACEPNSPNTSEFLVQPYLQGKAFSCSVFVDPRGKIHMLPLSTQRITVSQCDTNESYSMSYFGGVLGGESPELPSHETLVREAIISCGFGARGWVGVDLLLDENDDKWSVVEVNSRLTTSIVGAVNAYTGNLMHDLLQVWLGHKDVIPGEFKQIQFSCVTS